MSKSILIGIVVVLLTVFAIPYQTLPSNASIENNSSGFDETSIGTPYIPGEFYDVTLGHINSAQQALQNGDTEGANNHLELAKQSLEEYNSNNLKPVNPDIVITR
jgi:hypothetical protein